MNISHQFQALEGFIQDKRNQYREGLITEAELLLAVVDTVEYIKSDYVFCVQNQIDDLNEQLSIVTN